MKHIIIILITTISFFNCKAQSPILSIDELGRNNLNNAYYKDLNNELNPFEGTWLYANGNTSLKIVLVKKPMYFNGKYYEDLIIGEYQYIENGVEKIIEIKLSDEEKKQFDYSIKAVQGLFDAAKKIDNQGAYKTRSEISIIKFYCANVLQKVVDNAIQVHGALGVTDDTILAAYYRHERAARIYDGADEVHKSLLARRILKPYRENR